jgi:peptide/bleomycin uptake transporter
MLREFFINGNQLPLAWLGLATFLGHNLFKAYLASAINAWYGDFYDLLQTHVADAGSGEVGESAFETARIRVSAELVQFGWIVAPAIVVHPLAGLIRNWWVFAWRRALMRSYLERWNTLSEPIEGASQRVHEDSQRFASGIHSCVSKLLTSVLTLIVFCPILLGIDPGLMWIAIGTAIGGLTISAFLGWPLVDLEVQNQKVEAQLRRLLVLLEATPGEVHKIGTPYTAFTQIFHGLTRNYRRLYLAFAGLSTWLSGFDQMAVILPYLIAAPRLFASDPSKRLSLGALVKITNAFSKVFDALNVISDSWLEINEFRSVLRRLREFERDVSSRPRMRLVPAAWVELSDNPHHGDPYSDHHTYHHNRNDPPSDPADPANPFDSLNPADLTYRLDESGLFTSNMTKTEAVVARTPKSCVSVNAQGHLVVDNCVIEAAR